MVLRRLLFRTQWLQRGVKTVAILYTVVVAWSLHGCYSVYGGCWSVTVTVLALIVVVGSHLVRNHVVIVIVARRTVQNRVVIDIVPRGTVQARVVTVIVVVNTEPRRLVVVTVSSCITTTVPISDRQWV